MKRKPKRDSDLATKRRAHNQQEIDNDSWTQLYCSSLRSLANANYDAAIDSSCQALDHLEILKTRTLDTIAEAYAMKGQFSKAMEKAERMIDCAPAAAIGYLRAGDTLAMQGRHKRAIQVYDQGIEKVPIDDGQYASLQDRKAASEAQLKKRVDFLTLLPLDIAQVIIEKLCVAEDEMLTCVNVSTNWRRIIIDCPFAWKNIPTVHCTLYRFLPTIGKHIKNLNISGLFSYDVQELYEAILDEHFCNVRHLILDESSSINRDQLLVIMTRLSYSLTQLTLKVEEDDALYLESILFACPNLEELCYHIDHGNMHFNDDASAPIATECNIKSLELKANLISSGTIKAILERCPDLQNLHVSSCTAESLKLISNLCPHIRTLSFNGPASVEPCVYNDDRPGLRMLKLYPVEHLEAEHVIQILENGQSTLQMLMISLYDERPNVLHRWNGLTNIQGENLTDLTYAYGNSAEMHKIVAAMIRNCKGLKSVALQSLSNVSDSNKLEEALSILPNLQSLILYDINKVNTAGLQLLFTTLADTERVVSLQNVSFKKCNKIEDGVLEALSRIKALTHVGIADCKDLTASTLKKFIIRLSSQKTVREFSLENMNIATDVTLCDIARISSLRRLALSDLPNITGTGVKYLAFQIKGLEWLKVFKCPQVDWSTMSSIWSKIRARRKK